MTSDAMGRLVASLADHYIIEREIGQGGMASVYLARDVRHDRPVAIKVMRPELSAVIGAERFLGEIRTTANLQHPHILGLIDSGAVDGTLWYAMPYVEGESLRAVLAREKQLPVAQAVRIATEVASALDYAHRHGVIHRDIKPENILLHDGSALVADFGIALAASKAGSRMTETGMSLGTPQYMSPEQAMGERELDARSDVYALGCVTYEMLAGEPPFSGPTAQAIVAKVMTATATPLSQLRSTVPPSVDAATMTALQKLPADRFRTAAEFAAALSGDAAAPSVVRTAALPAPRERPRWTRAVAAALLVVAAFMLGGSVIGRTHEPPMALGRAHHLTWDPGLELTPALSPDGRSVAYAAGSLENLHIMVRLVGEGRVAPLTGDTTVAEANPAWSPDGSRIYFLSRNGVFSAPAGGGPAKPEVPGSERSAVSSVAAAPDGVRLAITRGDSLLVREGDGRLRGVARLVEPTLCNWSPNGTWVACATGNPLYSLAGASFGNLSPGRVVICRVSDGRVTAATDSLSLNTSPTWSPDGKWLYFVSDRDGQRDVYGVAVTSGGAMHGAPLRFSAGLGAHTISMSASGTQLAYSLYTARSSLWMLPIPPHPPALSTNAARITGSNEYIEQFSVSRDEHWLYYDSNLPGNDDIFRIAIAGGEPQQLTSDPSDDFAPDPSPDGKAFAFHSWRSGSRDIFVQQLDGSGVTQVTHTPRQEALVSWSPDGSALAYSELTDAGGAWVVRRDASGRWGTPVRRWPTGSAPRWSPDSRWLVMPSGVNGGDLEVIGADSGAPRLLLDHTARGLPIAETADWAPNGLIYFETHDARGAGTVWSIASSGGAPTPVLRFDPAMHQSYRASFVVSATRIYFSSDDRESDIWVMDVKRR